MKSYRSLGLVFAMVATLSCFGGEAAAPQSDMDKALVTAINGLIEGATATKDFVVEQAPDVIRQFLTWKFAEAAVWAAFGAIIMGLVIFGNTVVWKITSTEDWEREAFGWRFFTFGISLVAFVPSVLCTIKNGLIMLKISVAPKVFLLEYAASLIK